MDFIYLHTIELRNLAIALSGLERGGGGETMWAM
jgi:hypothetical protein